MSSLNTSRPQCRCATAQWEMVVVYCLPRKLTPKAFSTGKHGGKFAFFLFFLFFNKQDNAYLAAASDDNDDDVDAISRVAPRTLRRRAVANESAADAVCSSRVRPQHLTGKPFTEHFISCHFSELRGLSCLKKCLFSYREEIVNPRGEGKTH